MERYLRIDMERWMSEAYGLKGLELVVFATIYAELECSLADLCDWFNMSKDEMASVVYKLKEQGLIYAESCPEELMNEHKWFKHSTHYLYRVDEESIL